MISAIHDFDFHFGRWRTENQRMREPLVGCTDWEAFDATWTCRPILDGRGNIGELVAPWRDGFVGVSLRLYDAAADRWSLYWASNLPGVLEPPAQPVHGRFAGGVGTFVGRELYRGAAVLVRYVWSDITARTATWEQAFSGDGGATWEANWRMRMTRLGSP